MTPQLKDGKQLIAGGLALVALAGATFVLTRALGRLLAELLMAEIDMQGGLTMVDTGAIPVIVGSDGRGPDGA
jgi:small-conductance mechanosensitive channel